MRREQTEVSLQGGGGASYHKLIKGKRIQKIGGGEVVYTGIMCSSGKHPEGQVVI